MANCRLCHPLTSFVGLSLHMLDVDFDKLATWYAMLDDLSVFLGPAPGVFNHLLSKKFKRAFWPYHFQSYLMQACVHRTLSKFLTSSQKYFSFSWRFVTRASVSDVVFLLSNQFFTFASTMSKLPPDCKNMFLSSAPQELKKIYAWICMEAWMVEQHWPPK